MVIFGIPQTVNTFKADFAFKQRNQSRNRITPIGEFIVPVGTYTLLLHRRLTLLAAVANLRSVVGRDGICVMSDQGSCLF